MQIGLFLHHCRRATVTTTYFIVYTTFKVLIYLGTVAVGLATGIANGLYNNTHQQNNNNHSNDTKQLLTILKSDIDVVYYPKTTDGTIALWTFWKYSLSHLTDCTTLLPKAADCVGKTVVIISNRTNIDEFMREIHSIINNNKHLIIYTTIPIEQFDQLVSIKKSNIFTSNTLCSAVFNSLAANKQPPMMVDYIKDYNLNTLDLPECTAFNAYLDHVVLMSPSPIHNAPVWLSKLIQIEKVAEQMPSIQTIQTHFVVSDNIVQDAPAKRRLPQDLHNFIQVVKQGEQLLKVSKIIIDQLVNNNSYYKTVPILNGNPLLSCIIVMPHIMANYMRKQIIFKMTHTPCDNKQPKRFVDMIVIAHWDTIGYNGTHHWTFYITVNSKNMTILVLKQTIANFISTMNNITDPIYIYQTSPTEVIIYSKYLSTLG